MSRFAITRSTWAKSLLWLFGATASRSYLGIQPDRIEARFGWYQLRVPTADISGVGTTPWPLWAGLGWRTNLRTSIGLIGSYSEIVHIQIRSPVRSRLLLIPLNITDLYVSVEDSNQVLAALREVKEPG